MPFKSFINKFNINMIRKYRIIYTVQISIPDFVKIFPKILFSLLS